MPAPPMRHCVAGPQVWYSKCPELTCRDTCLATGPPASRRRVRTGALRGKRTRWRLELLKHHELRQIGHGSRTGQSLIVLEFERRTVAGRAFKK